MLINLDDTISSRDNMGSESNLGHGEDEKKYVELNLSGNGNNYNEFPTVLIQRMLQHNNVSDFCIIVSIL